MPATGHDMPAVRVLYVEDEPLDAKVLQRHAADMDDVDIERGRETDMRKEDLL